MRDFTFLSQLCSPCFKLFAIFVLGAFSIECNAECTLKSTATPREIQLLNLLKPLYGKVYEFKDATNATEFSYKASICSEIEETKDNSSIVQYVANEGHFSLGRVNSTEIMGGNNWIILTYYDGVNYAHHCNGSRRSSRIMIICDPDSLVGKMQIIEEKTRHESSDCYYLFEVGSSVSCTAPLNIPHGLSSGSVFCILFFIGLLVYLICGFLYKRIVVGAQGWEQFPNYGFWRDFGNLQADGCDFVCRWGTRSESQGYHGIDDCLPEEDERDDQLLNM